MPLAGKIGGLDAVADNGEPLASGHDDAALGGFVACMNIANSERHKRLALAARPARTVAGILCLLLLLGLFGGAHPAFDSFAHFRAHLAVLLGLAGFVLLLCRARGSGLLALALAGLCFATTLPPGAWQSQAVAEGPAAPRSAATYRLLQLNLRFDHSEPKRVLSLIARERPDVITLEEVSPNWRQTLSLIEHAYPHRIICRGRGRIGGVAILSRRPILASSGKDCLQRGRFAAATLDFGGTEVTVAAIHLGWPWPAEQMQEIEALLPRLAALGDTAILAGDFNATPWSAAMHRIAGATGFAPGPRTGATWLLHSLPPALRRWVGLPIDHVMAKPGITLTAVGTAADAGSDHLPLLASFSIVAGEDEPGTAVVNAEPSAAEMPSG